MSKAVARALARKKNGEKGFTLIELLIVVVIIGILAAVAIPIFLNQRQGAWRSSVESDVKNTVLAIETAATSNNGKVYGLAQGATADGKFNITQGGEGSVLATATVSPDDTITISFPTTAGSNDYTIVGTNSNLSKAKYTYTSTNGAGKWETTE